MEDAEQNSRHVERGRKHSAHKQTSCIACRLKDGAGRRKYNLNPYGERQYPEHGYGRHPLIAENNKRHFLCREEKQHAKRQTDKGEETDDAFVGTQQFSLVILEIAENRVHHRSDYLRDILQGQHHQTIRLFVISQIGHTHIFTNQQFVQIAAEIVDDIEQELIGGIGKYFPEYPQSECETQPLRVTLKGNYEDQYAGYDWVDNQCVQSCSAEGGGYRGCTCRNLNDEATDSNEFKFFVPVSHGSRHNGGGGEEQVDGQQLAQDAQGVALVVIGDDPRRSEKQDADSDARPYSK